MVRLDSCLEEFCRPGEQNSHKNYAAEKLKTNDANNRRDIPYTYRLIYTLYTMHDKIVFKNLSSERRKHLTDDTMHSVGQVLILYKHSNTYCQETHDSKTK